MVGLMMRFSFWLGLACVTLVSSCASAPPPRSQPSPLLNDVMPGFESETLSGNPLYTSGFEGRTLVVSFVTAGCEACERTLAAAQSMYADRHDVVVVGVFNKEQDAEHALTMASKHALKFPLILDPDGSITKRFKIEQVPRTFVVDGAGRVRWIGGSDMTSDGLVAAVSAAE